MENNDKRQAVFLHLIEADGPRTPSEIGDAIDETRQTVKYHLDHLIDLGVVINDGGAYRTQPMFTADAVDEAYAEALGHLLPTVVDYIEVDPSLSGGEQTTLLFNCVRMLFAMKSLGGIEAQREAATDGLGD